MRSGGMTMPQRTRAETDALRQKGMDLCARLRSLMPHNRMTAAARMARADYDRFAMWQCGDVVPSRASMANLERAVAEAETAAGAVPKKS